MIENLVNLLSIMNHLLVILRVRIFGLLNLVRIQIEGVVSMWQGI